ncbi:permease prefix domain 1-containing protein [Myceligenerans halotolerans]
MSAITTYLADLDAALVGPARLRRDLLQEAADHLEDATATYARAGYDERRAAERAVAEFGTVDEVAPGFQTTLAVSSARRTAGLLFAFVVLQPFVWGSPIVSTGAPTPGGAVYAFLDRAVEVTGVVMIAVAALLLVIAGIGGRWFDAGRQVALATAGFAMVSSVLLAGIGVAMTTAGVGSEPRGWLVLGIVVGLPMALVAVSARRTLATC